MWIKNLSVFFVVIIIIGVINGLLFRLMRWLTIDEIMYPSPTLLEYVLLGMSIIAIGFMVLEFIKMLQTGSNPKGLWFDMLAMFVINLVIFYLLSRLSFGSGISGVEILNLSVGFIIPNSLAPLLIKTIKDRAGI